MRILSSSVPSLLILASLTDGISALETTMTADAVATAEPPSHAQPERTSKTPSLRSGNRRRRRGLIVSRRRPKIIGGNQVRDPNRFPYFALMDGNGLCGAVLISSRFVLTAAHCVGADDDFEVGISRNSNSGESLLESWINGGSSNDGDVIDYPYKDKIIHPDYDENSLDADIALYELASDVSEDLQYIRVDRNPVSISGTPLTVVGFGDTNPSSWIDTLSNVLLQTTVDYVSPNDCNAAFGGQTGAVSAGMLCAYEEGEDTCQGDSGGPLFRMGSDALDDALVGLVSWGVDCGGSTPGVYTRISYYYDWIVESMCSMNPSKVPEYVTCSNSNTGGGDGGDTDEGINTADFDETSTEMPTSSSSLGSSFFDDIFLDFMADDSSFDDDDGFNFFGDDDSSFSDDSRSFIDKVLETVDNWFSSFGF